MKTVFVTLVLACFSLNAEAQQVLSTSLIETSTEANKPFNWIVYAENDLVRIEYKFVNCDPNVGFDFEGVFFRFTNKSSSKLVLSWHKILHYAGTCRTCDYPTEYSYDLSLAPNQTIEADCDPQSGYDIKLFSKFTDAQYSQGDHLTAFELANLTVSQY
jgi:hypothetical protein